jgi:hypothetical protein
MDGNCQLVKHPNYTQNPAETAKDEPRSQSSGGPVFVLWGNHWRGQAVGYFGQVGHFFC